MIVEGNLRTRFRRAAFVLALASVAMLSLSACGTTASPAQPASATSPATAANPTSAVADASGASTQQPADTGGSAAVSTPSTGQGAGSGSVVEVQGTLREWAIDLSQKEVPAGKVRFTVTNAGQLAHNFTVMDSSGALDATPNFTGRNGPQTLEIDLKPGTYTIICSLPGHAKNGQTAQLIVK